MDDSYYISHGGKIPVKWTAPEVGNACIANGINLLILPIIRLFITRSTPLPVMCGALVVSCMRYGVSDTNLSKITAIVM